MVTAQLESFEWILPELKELIPGHWEELALNKDKVPLDPIYELYIGRERLGELLFMTLREGGKLIGYFLGFIAPGAHYRTCLTCTMDIFYVHPDYRGRTAELRLFRAVKQEIKARGVQRWFVGHKIHKDIGRFFIALGFEPVETHYSMWVGD